MNRSVRATWVPFVAAAAGAVLALKAVLVMATGDGVPDATAVMYLGGLLLGVVAAIGAGVRQRGWVRSIGVGMGGTLLLVLWIMGLGDALKPVIGVVNDSDIVKAEIPILLAGLVLLALAWRGRSNDLSAEPALANP